jgi:DNA-directed RNA polymerase subunit K/omega
VNKFEFVTIAGARARQLQAGCTPRVGGSDKVARLAMKEIREKKVERVETGEDAESSGD